MSEYADDVESAVDTEVVIEGGAKGTAGTAAKKTRGRSGRGT